MIIKDRVINPMIVRYVVSTSGGTAMVKRLKNELRPYNNWLIAEEKIDDFVSKIQQLQDKLFSEHKAWKRVSIELRSIRPEISSKKTMYLVVDSETVLIMDAIVDIML